MEKCKKKSGCKSQVNDVISVQDGPLEYSSRSLICQQKETTSKCLLLENVWHTLSHFKLNFEDILMAKLVFFRFEIFHLAVQKDLRINRDFKQKQKVHQKTNSDRTEWLKEQDFKNR